MRLDRLFSETESGETKNPLIINGFVWCGPGSNRRHKDFQSFALPTELPHHRIFHPSLSDFSDWVANIGRDSYNTKKLPAISR